MEKNRQVGRKDPKIGHKVVPGGLVHTDALGRESFVPDSLVFMRRSGALYIEIGKELFGPWPYSERYWVKSMDSGSTKVMEKMDFIEFRNS